MSQRSSDARAARGLGAPAKTAPGAKLPAAPVRPLNTEDLDSNERIDSIAPAAPTFQKDAPAPSPVSESSLKERIGKLERSNRLLTFVVLALAAITAYIAAGKIITEDVIVQQQLMESKELKLLDNDGNARLFLRMYSRVPVLQILDANGKPRMSLGLRFDDTPFLDLSDKTGRTRATFEMTEDDTPALRLFDEHGKTTFNIN